MTALSKEAFGQGFVLWNAVKQPITSQITVTQTNEMNNTLTPLFITEDDNEELATTACDP